MPIPPRDVFWEDLAVGDVAVATGRTVTEADITAFAGLSGDFVPLHTDHVAASEGPFGERIAHGLLGLSMASGGLLRAAGLERTVLAFLSVNWTFTAPVRIGDTLLASATVAATRPSRDPRRGLVTLAVVVRNQAGAVVQQGEWVFLVRRREPAAAGEAPPEETSGPAAEGEAAGARAAGGASADEGAAGGRAAGGAAGEAGAASRPAPRTRSRTGRRRRAPRSPA